MTQKYKIGTAVKLNPVAAYDFPTYADKIGIVRYVSSIETNDKVYNVEFDSNDEGQPVDNVFIHENHLQELSQ